MLLSESKAPIQRGFPAGQLRNRTPATAAVVVSKLAGWPTLISPAALGTAFVTSLVVGLFFGYYPARRAARLPARRGHALRLGDRPPTASLVVATTTALRDVGSSHYGTGAGRVTEPPPSST